MIEFTTEWARRVIKSQQHWEEWVTSLQEKDEVLFQEFIPRSNSCIDSQYEMWRFWKCRMLSKSEVLYNNEASPVKNGYARYWNSDDKWGEVFVARLVPCHESINPKGHFADYHAPIWCPEWETDRNYLFLPNGKDFNERSHQVIEAFAYCYTREVNQGDLVTVFDDAESVQQQVKALEGVDYLYSEPTWR